MCTTLVRASCSRPARGSSNKPKQAVAFQPRSVEPRCVRESHQTMAPRLRHSWNALLLDLLRRSLPGAQVARFDFRAVRPTFDLRPFSVHGKPSADGKTIELWAQDHEGWLTMQGTAVLF